MSTPEPDLGTPTGGYPRSSPGGQPPSGGGKEHGGGKPGGKWLLGVLGILAIVFAIGICTYGTGTGDDVALLIDSPGVGFPSITIDPSAPIYGEAKALLSTAPDAAEYASRRGRYRVSLATYEELRQMTGPASNQAEYDQWRSAVATREAITKIVREDGWTAELVANCDAIQDETTREVCKSKAEQHSGAIDRDDTAKGIRSTPTSTSLGVSSRVTELCLEPDGSFGPLVAALRADYSLHPETWEWTELREVGSEIHPRGKHYRLQSRLYATDSIGQKLYLRTLADLDANCNLLEVVVVEDHTNAHDEWPRELTPRE